MQKSLSFILLLLIAAISQAQSKTEKSPRQVKFMCPPCGCVGDHDPFDNAGKCAHCGAPLYATYPELGNSFKTDPITMSKTVAVLLFDQAEIIDFAGPWEVFAASGMTVFSVAKTKDIIDTGMGMKLVPDYTFDDCPVPDVLLIPGGYVDTSDSTTIAWIKKMNPKTEHTMSVCTGAYFLGAAGLLDGITSTTYYPAIPDLKAIASNSKVVDNVRFVDSGHIITSAGLSSGIDAALHLVSKYLGVAETVKIANDIEYNWNLNEQYVRGDLADRFVQSFLYVFSPFEAVMNKYEGDTTKWTVSLDVKTDINSEDMYRLIDAQLTKVDNFIPTEKAHRYIIKNTNQPDVVWKGYLEVTQKDTNSLQVTLNISK